MLERLSAWLATTPAHAFALEQSDWLIPATQTAHILAVAVVFGSSLVLSLRLAGAIGADWSPARWGQRLAPAIAAALAVLLLTGAMLITGEPERSLLNINFQRKMVLLALAVALAWLQARRLARSGHAQPTGIDRLLALALLALWLAIIAAGRWIAYS